jgi:hypothetical protein
VLPAPLLSLVDAWWLPSLLDSGDSHYYCIIYAEVNNTQEDILAAVTAVEEIAARRA